MTPKWFVGQQVLLQDKRIRAQSRTVLTHKPYSGPYVIVDKIQGDSTIGPCYRFMEVSSGKTYKLLVSGDRLKCYNTNRVDLQVRLPNLQFNDDDSNQLSDDVNNNVDNSSHEVSGLEPAIRILAIRRRQKKTEYLVLFDDNSRYWYDFVTDALLREYRVRQQKDRDRRKAKRCLVRT